MPDKLPTLTDLPSAATAPPPPVPPRTPSEVIDAVLAADAVSIDAPSPATPAGYWIRIRDRKAGTRSKVNCVRWGIEFKNGEATVPARATIQFQGEHPAELVARDAVALFRDDLGYEAVPIPAGTPLMPSDDVAKWQDALR